MLYRARFATTICRKNCNNIFELLLQKAKNWRKKASFFR